jgi:hypothetical protein
MSDPVQKIRERGTRGTLVTVYDVLGLITITPEERDALFAYIDRLREALEGVEGCRDWQYVVTPEGENKLITCRDNYERDDWCMGCIATEALGADDD